MSHLGECESCGGTGFQVRQVGAYSAASPCTCRTQERASRLLAGARIPLRYQHCDLGNYDEMRDASKLRAKKQAWEFAEKYPGKATDVGLLFVGGHGVGKTHLAVGILRFLVQEKGVPGLFEDFRDLLKEIQETYSPDNRVSASQVLQPVFEAEVLVLDDLGAAKPTDWVRDTLGHIINRRYNEQKCTIFTSSLSDQALPEDNPEQYRRETLSERIGEALWSRLGQMCKVIPIQGLDHRRSVGKADFL